MKRKASKARKLLKTKKLDPMKKIRETAERAQSAYWKALSRFKVARPVARARNVARALVGGFSNPSKMPCFGWSTPASDCVTGTYLRAVVNSICSICYALKGRYVFENTVVAMTRRRNSLKTLGFDAWAAAMATALSGESFFRAMDSGDLSGDDRAAHLVAWVQVARLAPWCQIWLPTREAYTVHSYLVENKDFPPNLTVRVSLPMQGMPRPKGAGSAYLTSGVEVTGSCPAPKQGGFCTDCRKCWNKKDLHVTYSAH